MTTISAPMHVYVHVYLYIYYKLFKFEASIDGVVSILILSQLTNNMDYILSNQNKQ
jgi:hypothetical protein